MIPFMMSIARIDSWSNDSVYDVHSKGWELVKWFSIWCPWPGGTKPGEMIQFMLSTAKYSAVSVTAGWLSYVCAFYVPWLNNKIIIFLFLFRFYNYLCVWGNRVFGFDFHYSVHMQHVFRKRTVGFMFWFEGLFGRTGPVFWVSDSFVASLCSGFSHSQIPLSRVFFHRWVTTVFLHRWVT